MAQDTKRQNLVRLDVDASLLQWAMNRSGKHVDELSKKQSLNDLGKWLAGTKKPTQSQLEKFARATYTPFGHLLLPEPPQEQPSPIPHFRTMSDGGTPGRSINLEDTIRIVEQRQEWIRDYLIGVGAEPLEFVGTSSVGDDPVEVSDSIRAALGLDPDWAARHAGWSEAQKYLCEQMENTRIFVSKNTMVHNNRYRPLDPEEFRGFVLVDEYAPFVFINGADVDGAQMFTLAHELAHIWMGKSASFDLRNLAADPTSRLETACNKIAAEFLASTEEMRQNWDQFSKRHDDPYKAASDHFKVSRIVAARRARDTGLVSQADFDDFYRRYVREKKAWKETQRGGPSFNVIVPYRISKRFLKTVITAVGENELLYRDAHFLTGLKSETFDHISNRIKGDMH